ncbi:MAG: hypothetical protein ABI972_09600, partial [Acidobacteriota bacterium]
MRRTLLCVAVMAAPLCAAKLTIHPDKIELAGRDASQTFVVSYAGDDGYERDVTRECAPDNVARASLKEVKISCKGLTAVAPVTAKGTAKAPTISFVRDVSPIFTMSGCAGSNCHGSIRGQRGFKLSLFGYEPKLDFEALTAGKQPRVNVKEPEKSLILAKATAQVAHGGGFRFAADSLQYR